MWHRTTTRMSLLGGLLLVVGSCSGDSPTAPPPVCTISIAPASASLSVDGGSGSVTVTTAAGCAWSVTGGGGWLTLTSPGSGSGPATITYTVAVNTDPQARSGVLLIGGQSHTVTQPGRPASACTYEMSQERADVPKDAGTGTVSVRAPANCSWTATSTASWLLVTGGTPGSGDGTVSYAFTSNPDVGERSGMIQVADRTLAVRQDGDVGQCQYSVAPVDLSACMPGGTLTAMVTTQASCPWTATSDTSWLTLQSAASGSGSGPVTFGFSDNYDAPRQGTIQVRWPTPSAGQNVRFAQAGCLYAVTRNTFDIAADGGTGTFDVLQQSDPNTCGGATQDRCVWSAIADVSWITVSGSMPRAGDNPVSFTVAANPGTAPRAGRIVVRDKVVSISQAGR